jgi:cell wall-associated protease
MKKISLFLLLLSSINLFSQAYPKHWHLEYSPKDTIYGIDLTNAIKNNPVPSTAKTVVVAVIDNGTDIMHPDLAKNIWVNEKEIPGNAVDDDHNGYVDDINGWDFLGNMAQDIKFDNLEMTRLLKAYKTRFGDKTSKQITKAEKADYKKYKEIEKEFEKKYAEAADYLDYIEKLKKPMDALLLEIDTHNLTLKYLENFEPKKPEAKMGQFLIVKFCKDNPSSTPMQYLEELYDTYKYLYTEVNYRLNLDFDPRPRVGDDYMNPKDTKYGNNEVKGPDAGHGTHVSGTIGAVRDNEHAAQGIASMVKIMVIRAVPDGDERDKDVANAIRYAVDNGAKVINMSFGKSYSFNKTIVDEAVKYAESKDVLMIHAAGNDGQNNDKANNFPTPKYEDGSMCKTWIEVGASDRDQSPAPFSNYGKKSVNVFAPGVQIFNTYPEGKYKSMEGTSMASPVVAGLAALIRSYYPHLTAIQVKKAIESSVEKPSKKVKVPGKKGKKTKYKKLGTTAGIINADKALKAAAAMK